MNPNENQSSISEGSANSTVSESDIQKAKQPPTPAEVLQVIIELKAAALDKEEAERLMDKARKQREEQGVEHTPCEHRKRLAKGEPSPSVQAVNAVLDERGISLHPKAADIFIFQAQVEQQEREASNPFERSVLRGQVAQLDCAVADIFNQEARDTQKQIEQFKVNNSEDLKQLQHLHVQLVHAQAGAIIHRALGTGRIMSDPVQSIYDDQAGPIEPTNSWKKMLDNIPSATLPTPEAPNPSSTQSVAPTREEVAPQTTWLQWFAQKLSAVKEAFKNVPGTSQDSASSSEDTFSYKPGDFGSISSEKIEETIATVTNPQVQAEVIGRIHNISEESRNSVMTMYQRLNVSSTTPRDLSSDDEEDEATTQASVDHESKEEVTKENSDNQGPPSPSVFGQGFF